MAVDYKNIEWVVLDEQMARKYPEKYQAHLVRIKRTLEERYDRACKELGIPNIYAEPIAPSDELSANPVQHR